MNISPPQLLNPDVYVSGDVTIDPSAAIAPGVLVHADPDAQIVIGAGVCIGQGAILHAQNGLLEIETGAVVGAKVLVVGAGKIGENACIGSETTLLAIAIEPGQVIPPKSLIGDTSRRLEPEEPSTVEPPAIAVATSAPQETVQPISPQPEAVSAPTEEMVAAPSPEPVEQEATGQLEQPQPSMPPIVYGKNHLSQLLDSLLPHRKAFNGNSTHNPS